MIRSAQAKFKTKIALNLNNFFEFVAVDVEDDEQHLKTLIRSKITSCKKATNLICKCGYVNGPTVFPVTANRAITQTKYLNTGVATNSYFDEIKSPISALLFIGHSSLQSLQSVFPSNL